VYISDSSSDTPTNIDKRKLTEEEVEKVILRKRFKPLIPLIKLALFKRKPDSSARLAFYELDSTQLSLIKEILNNAVSGHFNTFLTRHFGGAASKLLRFRNSTEEEFETFQVVENIWSNRAFIEHNFQYFFRLLCGFGNYVYVV
jgi:hypothetical protein